MAQRTPAAIALGRAVVDIRERKNLSQMGLHLESGVSRKTLSRLEQGHSDPQLQTLRKVAAACRVTVVDILALADELEARARGARRRKPVEPGDG